MQSIKACKWTKNNLVVEKIAYDKLDESYLKDIFTLDKTSYNINNTIEIKSIYDYVFVDAKKRDFVKDINRDSFWKEKCKMCVFYSRYKSQYELNAVKRHRKR